MRDLSEQDLREQELRDQDLRDQDLWDQEQRDQELRDQDLRDQESRVIRQGSSDPGAISGSDGFPPELCFRAMGPDKARRVAELFHHRFAFADGPIFFDP